MQAIVETVFDAVYLVSVITIGILMICGCKGSHQFKLFGLMAVVLGAGIAASKAQDVEAGSAPHKAGKPQQDTAMSFPMSVPFE